ncbi:transcriptional regulator [Pseudoduganella sp. UC29_106]|uniref:transcriptional regulator n=1 Tax=Pseudoduganella sp. UC29_106 TaxID=3374553 RepID=UPI003756C585
MELIEAEELAEFEHILRENRLPPNEFSLKATDTTDPKTDEIQALQGELTICRESTGQTKQYVIGDGNSWLMLFRNDVRSGAFLDQSSRKARPLTRRPSAT